VLVCLDAKCYALLRVFLFHLSFCFIFFRSEDSDMEGLPYSPPPRPLLSHLPDVAAPPRPVRDDDISRKAELATVIPTSHQKADTSEYIVMNESPLTQECMYLPPSSFLAWHSCWVKYQFFYQLWLCTRTERVLTLFTGWDLHFLMWWSEPTLAIWNEGLARGPYQKNTPPSMRL